MHLQMRLYRLHNGAKRIMGRSQNRDKKKADSSARNVLREGKEGHGQSR